MTDERRERADLLWQKLDRWSSRKSELDDITAALEAEYKRGVEDEKKRQLLPDAEVGPEDVPGDQLPDEIKAYDEGRADGYRRGVEATLGEARGLAHGYMVTLPLLEEKAARLLKEAEE